MLPRRPATNLPQISLTQYPWRRPLRLRRPESGRLRGMVPQPEGLRFRELLPDLPPLLPCSQFRPDTQQSVRRLLPGDVRVRIETTLQALVYDILPSTTAVFSDAIGSRKLSANEQFFVCAQTVVSLLQTTQMKQGVSFIAANKVYTSTNKTIIV